LFLHYLNAYEKKKSKRSLIADKFRSDGQAQASRINREKERELKNIQYLSFQDAEIIKDKPDAVSILIFAKAYDKYRQLRSLYCFLQSMEPFETTFD